MAVFTNAGLTLLATALQTSGANVSISYVSIGLGAGSLSSGLNNGTFYTSLPLNIALAVTIANGQGLTILDSVGNTCTCTASGSGNIPGATSITVTSFNPGVNIGTGAVVVNTPAATDLALQNETLRLAQTSSGAGANPGESLNTGYFDPTQPTAVYGEVGYWGGSTATSSLGSGTLIARDVIFWSHTVNVDSALYVLDSTL